MEKTGSFADIFNALAGGREPPGKSATAPPARTDSVNLSVRGRNAAPRDKIARDGVEAAEMRRTSQDVQGNEARISAAGQSKAEALVDDVAWETRLKPRAQRPAAGADSANSGNLPAVIELQKAVFTSR